MNRRSFFKRAGQVAAVTAIAPAIISEVISKPQIANLPDFLSYSSFPSFKPSGRYFVTGVEGAKAFDRAMKAAAQEMNIPDWINDYIVDLEVRGYEQKETTIKMGKGLLEQLN